MAELRSRLSEMRQGEKPAMTLETEVAQLRRQLAALSLQATERIAPMVRSEGSTLQVEAAYRALLELTPQVIWIADHTGRTTYVNGYWFDYTGQTFEQTRSRGWLEVVHPDDRSRIAASWAIAVHTKSQYEDALRYRSQAGEYRWFLSRAVPLKDATGDVKKWFGVSTDMHDRRMAAEAIAVAEEKLRFAVDAANLGIYDFYPHTGQTEWSGKTFEMLGVPPTETPSMDLLIERIHPADREAIYQGMDRLLHNDGTGEYEVDYRVVRPDGTQRWVLSKGKCFIPEDHSQAGVRVTGVMMDITERKASEKAQLALTAALQHSPDFIGMTDLKGQITFLNRAGQKLVGLRDDREAKSKTVYEFLGPGAREILEKEILPAVHQGKVWNGEFCLRHFLTGESVLVDTRGFGVYDDTGNLVSIATVSRDISEKRKLEEQVRLSQRMESVGRLAGGIAHDFNNLLTIIRGAGEVLENRLSGDSGNLKMVERIREAADKAAHLTEQLLAFARKQVMRPTIFDVNRVVLRMQDELQRIAGDRVKVETQLQEGLWNVKMDMVQADQILVNLTANACEAMPNGGTITVETRNLEIAQATLQLPGVQPGQYVCVTFADSGKGMDSNTMQHIFEPFFTTKEMGRGVGLGLATVYGIVKQSQGHICVQSTIGAGTSFTLCLPRNDELAKVENHSAIAHDGLLGAVLVVEDEASLRTMIGGYLRDVGYKVFEASGPGEALVLARANSIDLLLTDMVMPGGGGEDVAATLSALHPEIKVIFMSGYAERNALQQALNHPHALFMPKPFRFKELADRIGELLGHGPMEEVLGD